MSSKVFIRFCNGWGYFSKFNFASNAIKKAIPTIEIISQPGVGGSGAFEIYATDSKNSEHLVHSKLKGDGFLTESNTQDCINKIQDIIKM